MAKLSNISIQNNELHKNVRMRRQTYGGINSALEEQCVKPNINHVAVDKDHVAQEPLIPFS